MNFCRRFSVTKGNDKEEKTFVYTYTGNSVNSDVVLLTDGKKPSYTETVLKASEDGDTTHIKFTIDDGDDCKKDSNGKDIEYNVDFEVFCDASITGTPVLTVDDSDVCRPKISVTHKAGCPVFQATSIIRWLANNPIVLGIILIAFGAVVTFFGGKFFPHVLASVAGGLTFLVVLLLASVLGALKALDKTRDPSAGQIALAVLSFVVALALAVFAGWFLKKIRRVGLCLLGTAGGFFGGFLLYTFVFAQWLDHVAVLIVLTVVLAALGGFLAWKFDRHIIIYITSFLGAYALVRGVSVFAGKFPNELVLYGQLTSGTFDGLNNEFYIYFGAIVVTGILGCVF